MGQGCGIDIGGSGIKAATVDLSTGELTSDRVRVATPTPSTPHAVAAVAADVIAQLRWTGPVGCTFPAVVTAGVARTAANVDASWVGTNIEEVVGGALDVDVTALNDADAAGLAEAHFGAARDQPGLVVVVTLGTGIGTALLHDGRLVPNAELGHLEVDGVDAETTASAGAREREGLGWKAWAPRLQRYLKTLENYLWPDLLVIGGGVSKKADKFVPLLDLRTPVVAAVLRNQAGIVGSAMAADLAGSDTGAGSRTAAGAAGTT
ncbi:MAG: ROK family protein [Actinomycetota bacterium]|nr:ROK family protein [Actinomycetota bacterium]